MKHVQKLCLGIVLVFVVIAGLFPLVAGEGFERSQVQSQMVTEQAVVGELTAETEVAQVFRAQCDRITQITLLGTTYGKTVTDVLDISLWSENGERLVTISLNTDGLPDGGKWAIALLDAVEDCRGQILTLRITSQSGVSGNAVSLFYGSSHSAGKYEVSAQTEYPVTVNATPLNGMLCVSVGGENINELARYYWPVMAVVLVLLLMLCGYILHCASAGKNSILLRLIDAAIRYGFLLRQLVSRDFKTKYKRSVLGVLWSLMNPLLTMMVMYIVFSTLFKTNIANFPVYLLIGIVCWNFFSEVTNSCLTAITGNTALITKVYVPKYMYPLSRVISSLVNLGFSLIPLFAVLLITKTGLTIRLLLLPFPLACLLLFALGMGLILASLMVFFRDAQFLWGVISTLWMYLTPIFYDASIIPQQFMTVYKMNPLYHIIYVMRAFLLDGMSPEPLVYILCLVSALVPLLLGLWIFKRTQDRFVLYL